MNGTQGNKAKGGECGRATPTERSLSTRWVRRAKKSCPCFLSQMRWMATRAPIASSKRALADCMDALDGLVESGNCDEHAYVTMAKLLKHTHDAVGDESDASDGSGDVLYESSESGDGE